MQIHPKVIWEMIFTAANHFYGITIEFQDTIFIIFIPDFYRDDRWNNKNRR